ncbi:MAG: hypothetical protein PVI57_18875 [Gemmatimonadota bacterium]|jgi:hypothetical protein
MNASDPRLELEALVAPDGLDTRALRVAEGVRARLDAGSPGRSVSPVPLLGRPAAAAAAVLALVLVRLLFAGPLGAPARPELGQALGIPIPSLERSVPRWLRP